MATTETQALALTTAERNQRYRDKGRTITVTVTHHAAREKLAKLEAKHGGVKAAIEAALRGARV